MSGPATRVAIQRHVPHELQALPDWRPWLAVPRQNGKVGKAPAGEAGGRRLVPTDPRGSGLPLGEALGLMERYRAPGVGIILRPGGEWLCLDLDGQVPEWAAVLARLLSGRAYMEHSPSGCGAHLWLPVADAVNRRLPGLDLIATGFVTVTGAPAVLDREPPEPHRRANEQLPDGCRREIRMDDHLILQRLRAARNGRRASALLDGDWRAYPSPSEADMALVRMLRFWTRDRAQLIRLLWSSGLARTHWQARGYLERTVDRALAWGGPVWTGGDDRG